jgi:hypothetical protein
MAERTDVESAGNINRYHRQPPKQIHATVDQNSSEKAMAKIIPRAALIASSSRAVLGRWGE